MKKLVLSAVIGLFISATALAEVVVLQNGQTTSYEQGTPVTISGEMPARVLYDGVLIVVPQGQKVQISKAKDGSILVTGDNISGVEVAGEKIFSKGQATFSVSPNNYKVSKIKYSEAAAPAKQKENKPTKVVSQKNSEAKPVASAPTTVEFPTVSEYVNEVVTQQATIDVMSPSSPR